MVFSSISEYLDEFNELLDDEERSSLPLLSLKLMLSTESYVFIG